MGDLRIENEYIPLTVSIAIRFPVNGTPKSVERDDGGTTATSTSVSDSDTTTRDVADVRVRLDFNVREAGISHRMASATDKW